MIFVIVLCDFLAVCDTFEFRGAILYVFQSFETEIFVIVLCGFLAVCNTFKFRGVILYVSQSFETEKCHFARRVESRFHLTSPLCTPESQRRKGRSPTMTGFSSHLR